MRLSHHTLPGGVPKAGNKLPPASALANLGSAGLRIGRAAFFEVGKEITIIRAARRCLLAAVREARRLIRWALNAKQSDGARACAGSIKVRAILRLIHKKGDNTMAIKATTPLEERMAKHVAGQITWPEPAMGKYCDACRFFYTGDVRTHGKGRCDLVRLHANGKSNGDAFVGADAIACPQIDLGTRKGNEPA